VTDDVGRELHALRERLEGARPYDIGFPGAVDVDYGEVLPMLAYPLNNVGDPYVDGIGSAHTKHLEREVVEFFADLFRAPADDRWGYVTTGGTDGNEYGLHLARSRYPDGVVYHSEAAHPVDRTTARLACVSGAPGPSTAVPSTHRPRRKGLRDGTGRDGSRRRVDRAAAVGTSRGHE
jgi:histidine decarboxylase